jgi:hypothetical protein
MKGIQFLVDENGNIQSSSLAPRGRSSKSDSA